MHIKIIGILNFQYSTHNYGAVLQAAALEFILKQQGHEVEHINFIPSPRKTSLKGLIRKVLVKIGFFKQKEAQKPSNSVAFEKFRESFLTRSAKVSTPEEFSILAKKYDTVVVGSDQVWRPRMVSDPLAFFLSYVPDNVERVSYAASFGAADWELELNDPVTLMAHRELRKFKAISCRETSGLQICKNLFDVSAIHVLDPLLQVSSDFFEQVIERATPSSARLVYYKLDEDQSFLSALKQLEERYGYKAHNLYRRNGIDNDYEEVAQWVRNLYDADIVVSDSFHCICLALRFGKQVFYSPNPARGQARMDDLFEYLCVDLVNSSQHESLSYVSTRSGFNESLAVLREASNKFLSVNI